MNVNKKDGVYLNRKKYKSSHLAKVKYYFAFFGVNSLHHQVIQFLGSVDNVMEIFGLYCLASRFSGMIFAEFNLNWCGRFVYVVPRLVNDLFNVGLGSQSSITAKFGPKNIVLCGIVHAIIIIFKIELNKTVPLYRL